MTSAANQDPTDSPTDVSDWSRGCLTEDEFVALFSQMRDPVFTFAARRLHPEGAKDVVGETFEVAWGKRDQAPTDPAQWPAWVIGIARNKVLQELQRATRKHHDNRFIADSTGQFADATPDIVAEAVVDSLLSRTVYARLTLAEKELFDMALLRGVTVREAAGLLGITVTAYTTRLSRLRQRITTLQDGALPTRRPAAVRDSP